ncbi:MAG TPA: fumarylacetoacetate hydrolase family protein [Hyphomicrobiaceae bacterium]|jgi:2-keto-4-pentenoate hydratase/2-oxohepta-3-ene-1,7-dioic acid hydratase in catechol pathway|nr:fumarylacetoacetate hydrolase family protein [Hyphomicrobiaceae bacterium]
MKLATFNRGGHTGIGVVDTARGQLLDLAEASKIVVGAECPDFANMLALIDAAGPGLEHARRLAAQWPSAAALPLDQVRLLSPLPEPRQMRDCLTFELHLRNAIARFEERTGLKRPFPDVWFQQPIYYKANRFSFIGHEADVIWPRYSTWMDYELELAAVVGKTGKDIAPEKVMEHIFGFTIFNDFSARDAQYLEMAGQLGPAKGKDFDTGNALGPWIVTTDEIGDPHSLNMDARVNGERWGGGNSRDMHHKWPAILAHISASETLYAGEVIGSGTVGTGCGLELGKQLRHGDVVELQIENIGVLRNRVLRP